MFVIGNFCQVCSRILSFSCLIFVLAACGGGGGGESAANESTSGDSSGNDSTDDDSTDGESVISVRAIVGEESTQLTFGSAADGFQLYRSTDLDCDLEEWSTCDNGQSDILNGEPISDAALGHSREAVYSLENGSERIKVIINSQTFPKNGYDQSQIVSFNEKLWLIGGSNNQSVWSSFNGSDWLLVTDSAPFDARRDHQLKVFDNKIWLIGGRHPNATNTINDASSFYNDVWASSDGKNWVEVTDAAAFSGRAAHRLLVNNNALFLIGGYDSQSNNLSDVWSSTDGKEWTRMTAAAEFGKRMAFDAVAFDGRLWLVGGLQTAVTYVNDHAYRNDVWSSTDGTMWSQETTEGTVFSERMHHKVVVYNGSMWLVGGENNAGLTQDAWVSANGKNWQQPENNNPPPPVARNSLVVFDQRLWSLGGYEADRTTSAENSTWYLSDNGYWTIPSFRQVYERNFGARSGHQVVSFRDQLWLIGGVDFDEVAKNDVWSSSDGINWTLKKDSANFSSRYGHQVVSFNDKLWLFGGKAGLLQDSLSDLWSSDNGVDWQQVEVGDAFANTQLIGHRVVVFKNKMWVLGGTTASAETIIWSSDNGTEWENRSLDAETDGGFGNRFYHELVVFNDELWLVGGIVHADNNETFTNEVWKSSDGISWNKLTPSPEFTARAYHELTVYQDKLWIVGGRVTDSIFGQEIAVDNGEVWSSSDGITWQPEAGIDPRDTHQVVVFDNKLISIAGRTDEVSNFGEVWVYGDETETKMWGIAVDLEWPR